MTIPSNHEKALRNSVSTYADVLRSDVILPDINEGGFDKRNRASTIGTLANNLSVIGDTDGGISLAEGLSSRLDIDTPDARFSLWHAMAEDGGKLVRRKLYAAVGITEPGIDSREDEGLPDNTPTRTLMDLARLGDQRAVAGLHAAFDSQPDDDSILHRTRFAVLLYQVDPTMELSKVLSTAGKARTYALENAPEAESPTAEDASDMAQIVTRFSSALSGTTSESELERMYEGTDAALRYFAEDILKTGDTEGADALQQLMLSAHKSAELSSVRVAMGMDHNGKHANAVYDYLAVNTDSILPRAAQDIIQNLVKGGYRPAIDEMSSVLNNNPQSIDPQTTSPELLAELYKAGVPVAREVLTQLYPMAGHQQYRYPSALKAVGLSAEAKRLLYSRYEADSSFANGMAILRHKFDFNVWKSTYTKIDDLLYVDPLNLINRQIGAIATLAEHIRDSRRYSDTA